MSYSADEALALGGPYEELVELLRGEFEEDEFRREMLRMQAKQMELMRAIAQNTGNVPDEIELVGGDGGGENGDGQDSIEGRPYWTTEEDITVTSTSYETEGIPFTARTMVLTFDNPVTVSFLDPQEYDNVEMNLTTEDSPFSISGVDGLFVDTVYYSLPEDGASDVNFDIIAVR